jgi:predicted Fe-S protein YdhL (DUF1289 family)
VAQLPNFGDSMPSNGSAPVTSPCVKVCKVDAERGLCTGCLRTLDEIGAWGRAGDAERRATLAAVANRNAR